MLDIRIQQQRMHGCMQPCRNLQQCHQSDIPAAPFNAAVVGPVHAYGVRKRLLAEPHRGSPGPKSIAKAL
jgi:hypothetical protein